MNKEKGKLLWLRFLNWPGWTSWLHWKGWKAIGNWPGWTSWLRWPVWRRIGAWGGWKKLLFPHWAVMVLLIPVSAAGLIWTFLTGREDTLPAYLLYCLSFYALIILLARLPGWIKRGRGALCRIPIVLRLKKDKDLYFRTHLYFEQILNFFYGVFKIISGVIHGSAWIGADGIYNLVQSLIQLVQILRRRKTLSLVQQWKSYRICGLLILALHLTMTGPAYQMIHLGRAQVYPGYLIFVTALFAFYKLISAFISVAKDRKHPAPIDSSVRLMNLSQAFFSLFSLQAAMIHQFDGSEEFAVLMNSLTGYAVCLLVVGMGIYMLRRGTREIRKWNQERC